MWVVPTLVMLLAGAIRFWNLGFPNSLVFDEVFYVRDAASQRVFGYPTEWPDNLEYAFGQAELAQMSSDASYAVHPPLGKWLISIGLALFGDTNGWGWRFSVALAGTLTVGLIMLLAQRLTRSVLVASLAGFLLAIEGVSVVMSRVGLLDGFLAFFALLGVMFMVLDHDWVNARWLRTIRQTHFRGGNAPQKRFGPLFVWRPWLIAAAVAFGCASAIKWSGLYFVVVFGLVTVIRDALLRRRFGITHWLADATVRQAPITALIMLPMVGFTYVASWAGWIFTEGGWGRTLTSNWWTSLWAYHLDMFQWHSTLQAPHPYLAHPLSWLLAIRPTSMFFETVPGGTDGCPLDECVAAISPIPNVLIWWAGVAAIVWLVIWLIRRAVAERRARSALAARQPHLTRSGLKRVALPRFAPAALTMDRGALFALAGFVAGYVPWLITVGRSAVFQFYTVAFAPYLVLALTLVLWRLVRTGERDGGETARARRWLVTGYLIATLLVSLYFVTLWLAIPTSLGYWNLHMWLPSWR